MTEDSGDDKDVKPPNPTPDTASLLKRLAGASVTKAGLSTDQSEINRKIAEISKGSKFYENEKRKDKELTEHINRILKTRDELLQDADIERIEAKMDRLLDELELHRDLSQYIVHLDMDAFFANVAVLQDPSLKGKAFAVGGSVISTASYEARKFGVRSGMAAFVGKKLCPELLLLGVDFDIISKYSKQVMNICREYDPNMLVAGCDEGYMNITKHCEARGLTPEDCVNEIRTRIFETTGLTASAGIAPNMMLAKICSDKNKPNGQFKLPFEREAIMEFMHDMPVRKLPGVGKVNERLLDSIGVKTCGDVFMKRAVIWLMDKYFGSRYLFRAYLGIASNDVHPYKRGERKSIGSERYDIIVPQLRHLLINEGTYSTFTPISEPEKIFKKLEEIATELEKDMTHCGWAGKTVTLHYKLDTHQRFTRARSLPRWVTKKEELFNIGKELIKAEFPVCIRLIGLRVTKLIDLKANDAKGIKRFFEPTGTSPSKQPKLEPEYIDVDALLEESEQANPLDEDAMPGFHEHEEWEEDQHDLKAEGHESEPRGEDMEIDQVNDHIKESAPRPAETPEPEPYLHLFVPRTPCKRDLAATKPLSHPKRQPQAGPSSRAATPSTEELHLPRPGVQVDISSPAKTFTKAKSETPDIIRSSTSSLKPISLPAKRTSVQTFSCPICSKELQTDNDGLNAHVDFCLSKTAIMAATASASGSGVYVVPRKEKIDGKGKRKAKETASSSKPVFKRPKD